MLDLSSFRPAGYSGMVGSVMPDDSNIVQPAPSSSSLPSRLLLLAGLGLVVLFMERGS